MSPADSSECQKVACVTDDWGASEAHQSSRQFNSLHFKQFNPIPPWNPEILKTRVLSVVRTVEKAEKQ